MTDLLDRFTTHLKNALTRALCLAAEEEAKDVRPEHLLFAIGMERGSLGAQLLEEVEVKPDALRALAGKRKKGLKAENTQIGLFLSNEARPIL